MAGWLDTCLMRSGPWLAAQMIRFLHARLQPGVIGEEPLRALWESGQNIIISFWHDQLFLMVKGYRGPGAKVMISASKDGELIARTMGYFGVGSVRGSSTRGAKAAVKAMVDVGKLPIDLVITPDGPKGPRHQIKDGVVQLARLTRRPVVPMAFACSHGHRFRSWDRFLLPYPWGRGVYSFGTPIYFQPDEPVNDFRQRVQTAMEDNTRRAVEHLNAYDLPAV